MYDFDRKLDQRGFDEKWDAPRYPTAEDKPLIPMWVADMDFAVPDCVLNAIRARLDHPAFGYSDPDPRFAQSIIAWMKERHGVTDIRPEMIRYHPAGGPGADPVPQLQRLHPRHFRRGPPSGGLPSDSGRGGRIPR